MVVYSSIEFSESLLSIIIMADLSKAVPVFLFGFFMLFTFKDIFSSQSTAEVNNKEIPVTNLGSSKFVGPTLKILYCYSCGYRNAFEQYSEMLGKKYPDMIVEGGNYPPRGANAWLARFLTIAKMLIILAIVSGADIRRYLGGAQDQALPNWWQWCLSNKIYASIFIFLICNMIEGQLMSTGAFEISFNDVPVWSKLETGRIPQPPELFQIIDNHLQLQPTDTNNIYAF